MKQILVLALFGMFGLATQAQAVDPKDIDATQVRKQLESEDSLYGNAYKAAEAYALKNGMEMEFETIGSIHPPDLFSLIIRFKPKQISASGKYPTILVEAYFDLPTNFEQVVLKKNDYKFYRFITQHDWVQLFPQPGDTSSAGGKQIARPTPTSEK